MSTNKPTDVGLTRVQESTCSPTQGGCFSAAFIHPFTITYRFIGHACNNKSIVGAPEEMGPAKGTEGIHLLVAPEKLVSIPSTYTLTHINMRASHQLGPNPKACQRFVYTILLK